MRLAPLIALLATVPACGSRRIAGYLEELESCSASSGETGEASTSTSGTSEDTTSSSEGSAGSTLGGSETTISSTTEGDTGTTEGAETTAESTGAPAAICGNGVVEAFGPEPEECDDGNLDPDDGCSDTCALDRRVFVSSITYKAGELKSLYIANGFCAKRADDQGWPDPLTYRAWLSDSATDAREQLTRGRGRLVMPNGLVFATSWSALLAGQLEHPLQVTEKSETYSGGVWTGTRPDGTAVPDSEHCDDWTSNSILKSAYYGYSDRKTAEWTMAEDGDQPSSCTAPYAIYCFQSL